VCKDTDQTKGSQNWKTLDVLQTELDQTQDDNNEVETAPLVFEILVQTERYNLEDGFDRENAREHLQTNEIHDAEIQGNSRSMLYNKQNVIFSCLTDFLNNSLMND